MGREVLVPAVQRFNKRAMAESRGEAARRRGPGRPFPKGVSGNPGGRPKEVAEVRDLARQHTEEAIRTLVTIMRMGTPDRARAAAAEALLDRGWGRPMQPAEMSGPGGAPLHLIQVAQAVHAMTDAELEDFIQRHTAARSQYLKAAGEAAG